MRRYSEAVKADVRRRMSPPHRQSVAQISAELGIHVVTLYNWRKAWRLQGEVVPASEKDPEGWRAIQTSCTYIASKASNQKDVNTAKFRSLILNHEDRCLSNEAFATQYIRGFGSMNGRCLYQADRSCIYERVDWVHSKASST